MLKGLQQLKHNIVSSRSRTEESLIRAITYKAESVLAISRDKYAPRDTGDLINDSGVTVESKDWKVIATIYYGANQAKEYALSVHEHPGSHDPPTWKGKPITFTTGGPKYLEIPFRESEKNFLEEIASKVKV